MKKKVMFTKSPVHLLRAIEFTTETLRAWRGSETVAEMRSVAFSDCPATLPDRYKSLSRRKGSLLRSKYTMLQCKYTLLHNNYTLLRYNDTLLRNNDVLLQCKYTLLRNNYALLRCKYPLLRNNYILLRCKYTLLRCNYALLRCNDTFQRYNDIFFRFHVANQGFNPLFSAGNSERAERTTSRNDQQDNRDANAHNLAHFTAACYTAAVKSLFNENNPGLLKSRQTQLKQEGGYTM